LKLEIQALKFTAHRCNLFYVLSTSITYQYKRGYAAELLELIIRVGLVIEHPAQSRHHQTQLVLHLRAQPAHHKRQRIFSPNRRDLPVVGENKPQVLMLRIRRLRHIRIKKQNLQQQLEPTHLYRQPIADPLRPLLLLPLVTQLANANHKKRHAQDRA